MYDVGYKNGFGFVTVYKAKSLLHLNCHNKTILEELRMLKLSTRLVIWFKAESVKSLKGDNYWHKITLMHYEVYVPKSVREVNDHEYVKPLNMFKNGEEE